MEKNMDIEDIRIEVIKSKRRTMGLEIQRDGKVIVRVPVQTTQKEIESFIDEHRTWIYNKLKCNCRKDNYTKSKDKMGKLQFKRQCKFQLQIILYAAGTYGLCYNS